MRATTVAILVPVKGFSRAKSRLVALFPGTLKPAIQEHLGIALFKDLVDVLAEFKPRAGRFGANVHVIACGPDPRMGTWLGALGGDTTWMDETTLAGYDPAVTNPDWLDTVIAAMNEHAMTRLDASGTIVLMGDLPLLTARDLEGLFKRFRSKGETLRKIVLSPSLGNGCNLIARFPPDIIDTCYSNKEQPSFIVHMRRAKERARETGERVDDLVEIYKNLEIYLDLDTPDDLMNMYPMLLEFKPRGHLATLLSSMEFSITKDTPGDTRQVRIQVTRHPA